MREQVHIVVIGALVAALWLVGSQAPARAHCDTMDGPVVIQAQAALEKGNVTPVLKWVQPQHEAEIRSAFGRTLQVRKLGQEARELADMYFFETLVRLHRAGEGEPYTGLKPAGEPVAPAIAAADRALETGNIEPVVAAIQDLSSEGITQRFQHVRELKEHAGQSVAAGREWVEAYVQFVHYVERLHEAAEGLGTAHAETEAAAQEH